MPTTHTEVALVFIKDANPGSFSALRPAFFVMPKAVKEALVKFNFSLKNVVSVAFAPGQPPSI